MRAPRDGYINSCAVVMDNKVFKFVLFAAVMGLAINCVSSMPQRNNVLFPNQHNAAKLPTGNFNNGIVPILTPPGPPNNFGNNNNNNNNNNPQNNFQEIPSEFQVGTTGISCNLPGNFVMAPDGCNRCFCAENGQLSSACSRALCPPGFPSSNQAKFNL